MAVRTFAAIDVGSFELTMKIYEFNGKKQMREIDSLVTRLALGTDTYTTGKISNEKVEELCRVLGEFAQVMKSYKVEAYRAYGTSAIRETENAMILLDKIRQRTGINIEILSNSEQRFLDYKSVASFGDSKGDLFRGMIEEGAAIVDIGGGSIQLSLFDNDTLVSTQNIRLGVLRVQERLATLNAEPAQMEYIVRELVSAQLRTYQKLFLKNRPIKNLILIDDYISPWASGHARPGEPGTVVESGVFLDLGKKLREHSNYQNAQALGMPDEKIPLLMISTILVSSVIEMMEVSKVWIPGVTLCDGIAYEYAEEKKLLGTGHDFERDIIACAVNISKRYMGSKSRGETLRRITGTIFDSMKKVHGLGGRERLYLEIASILHDCGKYISMMNIGERSYDIIMATEIIGLSHREREIVANVVRFNHTEFIYYAQTRAEGSTLDTDSYLIVAKLTAILRLANSLDRSHKRKMYELKAKLGGGELILDVDTSEDIRLEQAFFAESAAFFEEVYTVRPVLHQHKTV